MVQEHQRVEGTERSVPMPMFTVRIADCACEGSDCCWQEQSDGTGTWNRVEGSE